MSGPTVTFLGRGAPEIGHDENAHGCCEGRIHRFTDRDDSCYIVDGHMFPAANLPQAVPHVGFQPYAGSVGPDGDVPADET